jgi:aryl-alcohol dehydrogenase-like predicted oxidoreductase
MSLDFPRIELEPGYSISRIIKGGWQLAGGHGRVDEKHAVRDMWAFVEAGITTFDCADIYTGVEELIGKFIKECRDIQVHTKYVPDLDELTGLTKAYTEKIIDRSLKRLGIEQLDMVQFHWWDYSIPRYIDTALHLVDLQKKGKIRLIGVTNFDATHLRELMDAGVPVAANQVQYSVFDHRPESSLQQLALDSGMALLCYGTVAGGFLNERNLGMKEFPDPPENRSLVKYRLIIEEFGGMGLFHEVLLTLERIAQKHGVDIADVGMQYILQKPGVTAAVVGARDTKHLDALKKIISLRLDDQDNQVLREVLSRSKGPSGPVYGLERDREGRHGRIMRYNLNKK